METKICNTCKKEKSIDEFEVFRNYRLKKNSGSFSVRSTCKECKKEYFRKYYNSKKLNKKISSIDKKNKSEFVKWYKATNIPESLNRLNTYQIQARR